MYTKILILGDGDTVRRLPEVLTRPDIEVHVCAEPGSALAKSSFVKKFVPILSRTQEQDWNEKNQKLLKFLEESNYDMYVFSNDSLIRRVRDSQISLFAKQRILPVKNPEFFSIIDSKVGLRDFCLELEIPFPESTIFQRIEDCIEQFRSETRKLVIKGDQGHGGTGVLITNPLSAFPVDKLTKLREPILVQEHLDLKLIAVEALFVDGHLAGYLYSTPIETIGVTGPSTKRIFHEPIHMDFESNLRKLGTAGKLHGFFNTSWFLDDALGKHTLFELDARPNAWHQFGPKFGVAWSHLILNPEQTKTPLEFKIKDSQSVSLFPRSVTHALRRMDLKELIRWLSRAEGTWEFTNQKDSEVNFQERKELIFFWRNPLTNFAFMCWERLPGFIRNSPAIKNYLRRRAQSLGL